MVGHNDNEQKLYPSVLELDGTYVRGNRDGNWLNRCFSDLNEDEQSNFLATLNTDGLKRLCLHLADCLRHERGSNG